MPVVLCDFECASVRLMLNVSFLLHASCLKVESQAEEKPAASTASALASSALNSTQQSPDDSVDSSRVAPSNESFVSSAQDATPHAAQHSTPTAVRSDSISDPPSNSKLEAVMSPARRSRNPSNTSTSSDRDRPQKVSELTRALIHLQNSSSAYRTRFQEVSFSNNVFAVNVLTWSKL